MEKTVLQKGIINLFKTGAFQQVDYAAIWSLRSKVKTELDLVSGLVKLEEDYFNIYLEPVKGIILRNTVEGIIFNKVTEHGITDGNIGIIDPTRTDARTIEDTLANAEYYLQGPTWSPIEPKDYSKLVRAWASKTGKMVCEDSNISKLWSRPIKKTLSAISKSESDWDFYWSGVDSSMAAVNKRVPITVGYSLEEKIEPDVYFGYTGFIRELISTTDLENILNSCYYNLSMGYPLYIGVR